MSRREQEHLIQTVYPGSIAEELEIEPGDVLLTDRKLRMSLIIVI